MVCEYESGGLSCAVSLRAENGRLLQVRVLSWDRRDHFQDRATSYAVAGEVVRVLVLPERGHMIIT